jgi:hypothetical protein
LVGREELAALARVIESQLQQGTDSPIMGTWTVRFDGERRVLYFDKCEFGDYCEERPAVIDLEGRVIDPGGPLLSEG